MIIVQRTYKRNKITYATLISQMSAKWVSVYWQFSIVCAKCEYDKKMLAICSMPISVNVQCLCLSCNRPAHLLSAVNPVFCIGGNIIQFYKKMMSELIKWSAWHIVLHTQLQERWNGSWTCRVVDALVHWPFSGVTFEVHWCSLTTCSGQRARHGLS